MANGTGYFAGNPPNRQSRRDEGRTTVTAKELVREARDGVGDAVLRVPDGKHHSAP